VIDNAARRKVLSKKAPAVLSKKAPALPATKA
jgi:hypothetical protein